ncbi:MBOAT family O-acyltransferase [Marimonas lutisalis]|uniref:MBOAT family O-acyltransferase n=1 Tax=Marimonas lutisalis TaxID=2545756 RepID=UPI0010F65C1F|nr:MBOAT family O-acyltransferase [Marimonas lutisalis]
MLFTSPGFILFLPLALAGAVLLRGYARLVWLILASLVYYGTHGSDSLAAFAAVALVALAAGRFLTTSTRFRSLALWMGVAAILGLMGLLKYYEPWATARGDLATLGLTAPAGFSFYAFTAIALIVDRYRAPLAARAGPGQDLLFLAWFPKLLAGPLERITAFATTLRRRLRPSPAVIVISAQLILWGLVKKVVIADNLAPFVDRTYAIPAYAVPMELVIASYAFAFQIYCDFSGYTDMARGISRLFGIRLSENFHRPYFSTSVSHFWSRRWHITLSNWFRDYLYNPLIGNRKGQLIRYPALMAVFLASGLWHAGLGYGFGWGFLIWGALNGLFVWAERALYHPRQWLTARFSGSAWARLHAILAGLIVFHLILVTWVFFRAGNIGDAMLILRRIWAALPELPGLLAAYPFTAEHGFLAALVAALLLVEAVPEFPRFCRTLTRLPRWVHWAAWLALAFILLLFGRWSDTAFVYMQF